MMRNKLATLGLVAAAVLTFGAAACSSGGAPAPTSAPTTKQEPTKAPAAQPTAQASQPTAPASQPTKAAEPTKPAASASNLGEKPADWPKKAITLVVPSDAGGATDVGARLLTPGMEKVLGTSVEVVDKPGGGTQIGTTEVAVAKPDGYTIGYTLLPATITTYLDPERKAVFTMDSFAPIGLHVFDPGTISVAADSKYKTLKDVIDDAKARPGQVKIGTTGILGDDHLAVLQLEKLAGVKFATVHFSGGTTQLTALYGGHIDVGCDNVGTFTSQVKQGKARTLAVLDKERSKFIPDAPTAQEQGINLYSSSSRPLAGPKGMPKDVQWFISKAMETAMKDPDLLKKMDEQGLTMRYMNPDQLTSYWKEFEDSVKPLMSLARAQ